MEQFSLLLRLQVQGFQLLDYGASSRPDPNVMNDVSLERVLAFNKELVALSAAGLRIEIGKKTEPLEDVLDRVNSNLRLRTELGQSVADWLQDNEDLPPIYRDAVQTGLLGDSPAVILDSISSRWQAQEELRRTAGYSLVQPLILLTLCNLLWVHLPLSLFLSAFGGDLRPNAAGSQHECFDSANGTCVDALLGSFDARIVDCCYFSMEGGQAEVAVFVVPFTASQVTALRNATFADQLAALLTQGVPFPEGLRLAGGVTGDADLIETTETPAQSAERGEKLPTDPQLLLLLPPLLRWALTGDLGDQPLPDILSFAADTYRQTAQRYAAVYRIAIPTLIGAFLGGAVGCSFMDCSYLALTYAY